MNKKVFAIAAHPDDIEFMMGGTLFLLKDAGCELHYMNIANSDRGSAEHDRESTARIRRDEAISASKFLGAEFHGSLCTDPLGDILRNKVCPGEITEKQAGRKANAIRSRDYRGMNLA